jgi:NhaP-type Na+/H+ or K+/H+ antiporter
MEHHGFTGPALTVALAMAAGMLAQSIARHLKLPGIVVLLGVGVLLGPDLLDVVRPDTLGPALQLLVGFAVAVILFEGGLSLRVKRLRREARTIRALLTVGALITAVGGTLSARWLMGWDWRLAALFGSLVIVTGPTVVTPLLRRIKVTHRVSTVLEAEGVFIDAIGAVVAVVTLQAVASPMGERFGVAFLDVVAKLGFGVVFGGVGGLLLALLLRIKRVVPEGLENVFTLSLVLALFQLSNAVSPESGIMSVTMAGLVVGNMRTHVADELREFKEQLTVLFIGMLFVLLAADVRLVEVRNLGVPGLLTVLSLMFIVRPINVAACSWGSDLTWRERGFLAWLSPRGVVAAAVASLFAQSISELGISGGNELRALVFLVIAGTVLVQGLTGGLVAWALGVKRPAHLGYAVVGANELGHAIGKLLRRHKEEVVFIDNNPDACHVVERDAFRVVYGNPLEERTLQRARLEDRAACLVVGMSDEINFIVGQRAVAEYRLRHVYVAVSRAGAVTAEMIREADCSVLFGVPRDLELWSLRLRRGTAEVQRFCRTHPPADPANSGPKAFDPPTGVLFPLALVRRGKIRPVSDADVPRANDVLYAAVFEDRLTEAAAWFEGNGWTAAPEEETAATETVPAQVTR